MGCDENHMKMGGKNKKDYEEKNIENSPSTVMRFGLRNNDQAEEK